MKMSLLENAHGFLVEALKENIDAQLDPSRMKFAVFNLVQSIELLLKERLRREHVMFVYADVDNPFKKSKPNMPLTVTSAQALTRLQTIAKVPLSKGDIESFQLAMEWRNQIAHYEVDIDESKQRLETVFGKLLGFVSHFHSAQLGASLSSVVPRDIWANSVVIVDNFVEVERRALEQIASEGIYAHEVTYCLSCRSRSVLLSEATCRVCGWTPRIVLCKNCHKEVWEVFACETTPGETGAEHYCDDCLGELVEQHERSRLEGFF